MRTQGGEATLLAEAKYHIVQHSRGKGIEVGRGPFKAFPHFISVREIGDKSMPPNVAADVWTEALHNLDMFEPGSLDFAFLFADSVTRIGMARACRSLLKPDGNLIAAYVGDHAEAILEAGEEWSLGWRAEVLHVGGKSFTGEDGTTGVLQVVVFKRIGDDEESYFVYQPHRDMTACVVRHGAIGDTLQAASVLAELKEQGYHITWMCEPGGELLLRHDPRIDEFLVQDKDQVPNHELPAYWKARKQKFDVWINLCESVEGTLITIPGRANHGFPHALRHELCNHNYLEITAKIAQLKLRPEHHFYESDEERTKAEAFVSDIGRSLNTDFVIGAKWRRPFVVLWALAGSSVHKTWPHLDHLVARILLDIPEAHVIFTGDPACQILEAGWEKESRVHCMSGKLAIRDTLALAKQCDLVIGPETGVLNAVAFESMPKICFLSHSSVENLTKHWVNTASVFTTETPCYPCHQLHHTFEHCAEHRESGTAMCQFTISTDTVWQAVLWAYAQRNAMNRLILGQAA